VYGFDTILYFRQIAVKRGHFFV